jgi:hypothetical protein
MAITCPSYWQQINEIERALGVMRKFKIPVISDAYQDLYKLRGKLLKQVGLKFPRSVTQLLKLAGLSPGSITLWHDSESGWLAEARERPGAAPVYHYVGDEVAMQVLRGELTHELEATLMAPDLYVGE